MIFEIEIDILDLNRMEIIKYLYIGYVGFEIQMEEEYDFFKSWGYWNMDVGVVYFVQFVQYCSIVGG